MQSNSNGLPPSATPSTSQQNATQGYRVQHSSNNYIVVPQFYPNPTGTFNNFPLPFPLNPLLNQAVGGFHNHVLSNPINSNNNSNNVFIAPILTQPFSNSITGYNSTLSQAGYLQTQPSAYLPYNIIHQTNTSPRNPTILSLSSFQEGLMLNSRGPSENQNLQPMRIGYIPYSSFNSITFDQNRERIEPLFSQSHFQGEGIQNNFYLPTALREQANDNPFSKQQDIFSSSFQNPEFQNQLPPLELEFISNPKGGIASAEENLVQANKKINISTNLEQPSHSSTLYEKAKYIFMQYFDPTEEEILQLEGDEGPIHLVELLSKKIINPILNPNYFSLATFLTQQGGEESAQTCLFFLKEYPKKLKEIDNTLHMIKKNNSKFNTLKTDLITILNLDISTEINNPVEFLNLVKHKFDELGSLENKISFSGFIRLKSKSDNINFKLRTFLRNNYPEMLKDFYPIAEKITNSKAFLEFIRENLPDFFEIKDQKIYRTIASVVNFIRLNLVNTKLNPHHLPLLSYLESKDEKNASNFNNALHDFLHGYHPEQFNLLYDNKEYLSEADFIHYIKQSELVERFQLKDKELASITKVSQLAILLVRKLKDRNINPQRHTFFTLLKNHPEEGDQFYFRVKKYIRKYSASSMALFRLNRGLLLKLWRQRKGTIASIPDLTKEIENIEQNFTQHLQNEISEGRQPSQLGFFSLSEQEKNNTASENMHNSYMNYTG